MRRSLSWAAGSLLVPALAVLGPGAAPARADDFVPAPGTYRVDTDDLVISGPSGGDVGHLVGGVAVFDFDDVVIGPDVVLAVHGSRPARLEARGRMDVRGVIFGSGRSAEDGSGAFVPGGPGGGAGGAPSGTGSGPGGGAGTSAVHDGAGGGGHGGPGARGRSLDRPSDAAGGPAYAGAPAVLRGGSGGGGGLMTSGGGGGGAIELRAAQLTIAPTARVQVDGGGGGGPLTITGPTGGGSGGALVLRADRLSVQGALLARGGDGGAGYDYSAAAAPLLVTPAVVGRPGWTLRAARLSMWHRALGGRGSLGCAQHGVPGLLLRPRQRGPRRRPRPGAHGPRDESDRQREPHGGAGHDGGVHHEAAEASRRRWPAGRSRCGGARRRAPGGSGSRPDPRPRPALRPPGCGCRRRGATSGGSPGRPRTSRPSQRSRR